MNFSNNEKNEILNNLNKIVKKTYMAETKDTKIDNQYINMKEILDYYKRTNSIDFQKTTLQNLSDSSYESLLSELNHDRNDDKQKDEGKDIVKEDLEKSVNEQIDKSKLPSDKIDKEGIMHELAEMTEEEKDITSKDIEGLVKAATIKAIYKATLEKYEKNRKEIMKHSDIVRKQDGDFALEDRLAAENRMYEVYLQKLGKQYSSILPSKKILKMNIIKRKKLRRKKEKKIYQELYLFIMKNLR